MRAWSAIGMMLAERIADHAHNAQSTRRTKCQLASYEATLAAAEQPLCF